MNAPTSAGPSASAQMLTLNELAAEPYKLKCADRLRRHCGDGSLHGHRHSDQPGVRWTVALDVALAWKAGATPAEQRSICPLCALLPARNVTPLPRQRRGRRGT